MAGLDELGVPYFPSEANFVLMRIGALHKELVAAMRMRGVLLRDRSADPGCDGFVRITIGLEEQVTAGLSALGAALARSVGCRCASEDEAAVLAEGREYE